LRDNQKELFTVTDKILQMFNDRTDLIMRKFYEAVAQVKTDHFFFFFAIKNKDLIMLDKFLLAGSSSSCYGCFQIQHFAQNTHLN
jgi:hypothetical protein